jgi:hypothetical protein
MISFAFALIYFFTERIICEEYYLIQFFGKDYVDYRKSSFILIPVYKNLSDDEISEALIKNKYENYGEKKYQSNHWNDDKCD